MNVETQKKILDAIGTMTKGLGTSEGKARRETLMIGVVTTASALEVCPPDWFALVFAGRTEVLFRAKRRVKFSGGTV